MIDMMMAIMATLLLLVGSSLGSEGGNSDKRFNVLMMLSDDLRPELGAFGATHIHSPAIDELASRSLVLAANFVQQSVCGPTRASLLVGRRPDTLRTVTHTRPTYWRQRAGAFVTIPEMFRLHGWHTVSFGKVFDLRTSSYNHTAEWICDGPFSWSEPTQLCGTKTWSEDVKLSHGLSHRLLSDAEEQRVSDVVITNAAIARLNGSAGGMLPSPWLVAVGLHRPHLPFIVPKRHLDLYPIDSIVLPPAADRVFPAQMPSVATECAGTYANITTGGCVAEHGSFELWQQYGGGFNDSSPDSVAMVVPSSARSSGSERTPSGWGGWEGAVNTSLSDQHIRELRQYYFAAVSHTDELLGNVMKSLSAAEAQRTIMMLVGDHGWHLSENNQLAKCTNFDSATRAPFLLHVPGVTDRGSGLVSHQLTEHVDIMPSLAAAAGLVPPPRCPPDSSDIALCTEGVNVLPLLTTPTVPLRKVCLPFYGHSSSVPRHYGSVKAFL